MHFAMSPNWNDIFIFSMFVSNRLLPSLGSYDIWGLRNGDYQLMMIIIRFSRSLLSDQLALPVPTIKKRQPKRFSWRVWRSNKSLTLSLSDTRRIITDYAREYRIGWNNARWYQRTHTDTIHTHITRLDYIFWWLWCDVWARATLERRQDKCWMVVVEIGLSVKPTTTHYV